MRGLLGLALRLLLRHVSPLGDVYVVTPDIESARPVVQDVGAEAAGRVHLRSDFEVAPEARDLPGWFRQQYLKLHADRLAGGRTVLVMSADTLVLDPLRVRELVDGCGRPVVRYFRYDRPNRHLAFERRRVAHVASLLGTRPRRSLLLGDFICDLMAFDAAVLSSLRVHLDGRGGLLRMLEALGSRRGADYRFGEWTLYAVYCLDVLPFGEVAVRPGGRDFFSQIHGPSDLRSPARYHPAIVHFAWHPADPSEIEVDLVRSGRLSEAGL